MPILKRRAGPSWTIVAALLVTLYGALLRLDAFTGKYGRLEHPAWARVATQTIAPIAARLRPSAVAWGREPHPYVGGDPITYLKFGREMTSFYQPHVREPVFLALTKFGLWTVDDQDVGVSIASAIGSIAMIIATFLLGRAIASPVVGLLAAAVIAIEFEAITWGVDGWRDDTFTATFLFTAWAFVRLRERASFGNAVLVGITAGLCCLTRITALSFVLPALLWIALPAREALRERVLRAALAFAIMAVIVAPYLVSCAIATGDPFIAINYHTTYYRFSEGLPIGQPMSASGYLGQKFAMHPVATLDTGMIGLIVRPFVTKWNGLQLWSPWLAPFLYWSSLAGLAMWPFTPRGRLMLVILLTSLVPYAFTWNVGGGGQWRFTMHVYSIYQIAAVHAWAMLVSPGWRSSLRPLRWRIPAVATAALVGAAAYFALPWFVVREALVNRETVSVETGARDWIFYRSGWAAPRQEGAVTTRVSLEPQTTVHFPLTAKRSYDVALRFDPIVPETQRRVTVLLNRQLLGTLLTSWNPERVGSYRLTLPEASVHAGDNALTLVPDNRVAARDAGDRFRWIDPGAQLGLRFWYLRIIE